MFGKMKIYTVHIKPDKLDAQEKPIFVREGFNFYAFLFTVFWALYHRLWRVGLFLLFGNALLITVSKMHVMAPESLMIIQLAYQLVIGFQANDWLRAGLARRGYITHDVTTGDSLLRAEQRYFERHLAAAQ